MTSGGREPTRFTATVGLTDDSDTKARQRFEVIGDGRRLASADVSFGQSTALRVPVNGVLRLQLVVTSLQNDATGTAAWAEASVS